MNYDWVQHYFRDFEQITKYIEILVRREGWYFKNVKGVIQESWLVFKDGDYYTVMHWKGNGYSAVEKLLNLPQSIQAIPQPNVLED